MDRYDVIIIGKGPAGISAALYTARANLKTLVIGRDGGALMRAGQVENYFGFAQPVSGKELLETGVRQAARFGVRFLEEEATAVEFGDGYVVRTQSGEAAAPALLLATGRAPRRPQVSGVSEFEGRGVSYCTTCDGFFFRGKPVGVLGRGNFAVQEALELEPLTGDITLFTDGAEPAFTGDYAEQARRFRVDTRPVRALRGDDALREIELEGGARAVAGLFVAMGSASAGDFATRLGVQTDGGAIVVDGSQQTNLPGVFAAGDCTGGFHQVSIAVGQGAAAGKSIIDYVRGLSSVTS